MSIIKVICMASLIQMKNGKKESNFICYDSYAQGVCVDEKNIIGNLRNINKNNLLGLIT